MTYTEMRKKGMCVRCKGPSKEKALCPKCAEAESKYAKTVRLMFIKLGICPVCKRNPLIEDRKRCMPCTEKHREAMKRLRGEEKEAYQEKMRVYLKQRRERLKEEGLCVVCGKAEAPERYYTCDACRLKRYEECKKYWKKEYEA